MKTTLLLDADVVVYNIAHRSEEKFDWGDVVSVHMDDEAVWQEKIHKLVEGYMEQLWADDVIVCLSDDANPNWRLRVLDTYKATRDHSHRPELWVPVRNYLATAWLSVCWPTLEGDDVLGILATGDYVSGRKVVVSIDKDLRTIPGELFNPNKPERGIEVIDPWTAQLFHAFQVLAGDAVDNYTGCPGVGPIQAEEALEGAISPEDLWDRVVAVYEAEGLDEFDAAIQAAVSRILHATDYDFSTQEVLLCP